MVKLILGAVIAVGSIVSALFKRKGTTGPGVDVLNDVLRLLVEVLRLLEGSTDPEVRAAGVELRTKLRGLV